MAATALVEAIAAHTGVDPRPGGGRHRQRRRPRPDPGRDLRRGRRGRARLALVRGLPDPGPALRCHRRPGAARRRRPARPGRHGGGGHRPDPADPGLYAEQPDRPGRVRRRAGPVPGRRAERCPGRDRRGLCRVRPGRPGCPDALAVQRARPNVAVLRTFSKAYGLAGLRVGYAVASPDVAGALRKTAVPFGVSLVAQDAGGGLARGVRRAAGAGRRSGRGARAGRGRAARAGLGHPGQPGQFRLAGAG